jgi:hypothetical protein
MWRLCLLALALLVRLQWRVMRHDDFTIYAVEAGRASSHHSRIGQGSGLPCSYNRCHVRLDISISSRRAAVLFDYICSAQGGLAGLICGVVQGLPCMAPSIAAAREMGGDEDISISSDVGASTGRESEMTLRYLWAGTQAVTGTSAQHSTRCMSSEPLGSLREEGSAGGI